MNAEHARSLLEHPTAAGVASLKQAWAETRAPEVADVLEALGRAYLASAPKPFFRQNTQFQTAWLACAKAPTASDLSWLADTLMEQLPTERPTNRRARDTRPAALKRRLQALQNIEPDPRLAAAVARALVTCPFTIETAGELVELFEPAFGHLTADVRQAEVLADALKAPQAKAQVTRSALSEVLPRLITSGRAVTVRLDAPARAAWRALSTQHPVSPQTTPSPGDSAREAQLVTEMLAHEYDDAIRLVYADALLERGESRGEFISLQVRAHAEPLRVAAPKAPGEQRQRALLKEHQARWLGPLARVFTHLSFHRGFLREAALEAQAKAPKDVWVEALAHAELRFVRRLDQGQASAATYLSFLEADACGALSDFDVTHRDVLKWLLARPNRPVRGLTIARMPSVDVLQRLAQFEQLGSLGLTDCPEALTVALQRSGLIERLRFVESNRCATRRSSQSSTPVHFGESTSLGSTAR